MKRSKILSTQHVETMIDELRPPRVGAIVGEARAILDVATVPFRLTLGAVRGRKPKTSSYPIILLPGFASDQRYMKPLQVFLKQNGYVAEDWGLGLNLAGMNLPHTLEDISEGWSVETYDDYSPETYRGEGGVPYLCDQAVKQVRSRSQELDSPVILIGWSLGGYVAREVARELGEEVAQVITLGSPVVGGPKYTRAADLFKKKGYDLDWIETESGKRESQPISQPITAIFSKSDGVVAWPAAIDRYSPNVEHIEVNAPHLGMGFNRTIWRLIKEALQKHAVSPHT